MDIKTTGDEKVSEVDIRSESKILKYLRNVASMITLCLASCFLMFAAGRAYSLPDEEIIRNVISVLVESGLIIFLWEDGLIRGSLVYGNEKHMNRFFVIYIIVFVTALLFPLVNNLIWPYLSIFVLLSLFSNALIGICSGCALLNVSLLLCHGSSVQPFFIYLIAGVVAIVLFQHVGEKLQFGLPILISIMLLFVLLVAYHVLFLNQTFSFPMLTVPLVNVVISSILLLVLLNAFSLLVIRGSNDMYMDINDPEFELLVKIKNKDKREYYRAIHTAYLADRIAADIGVNRRATKACAYYHRVGMLDGKPDDMEAAKPYFRRYQFPESAVTLLEEYIKSGKKAPVSKEATIINLCEDLVNKLMAIFEKDKTAKIDSDRMIEEMIERRHISGSFNHSNLSIAELNRVSKLLKKEKLYYDFLR